MLQRFCLFTITLLLTLNIHGQHEAMLNIDMAMGSVSVQTTLHIPRPIPSDYQFRLYPIEMHDVHRRQLRKREKVVLSQNNMKWTLDTKEWKEQPHQSLEMHYTVGFKSFGALMKPKQMLVFNPEYCSECRDINPFQIRNFRWDKLLPSTVSRINLSIKITRDGVWYSNHSPKFTVDGNFWILLNFGEVDLETFYFYWRSTELFATAEGKQDNVRRDTPTKVKTEDSATELNGASTPRQMRKPVLVSLPQMPILPRPLDARSQPKIWTFAAEGSPYDLMPIMAKEKANIAFTQRYDPPFMGFFNYVSEPLYQLISTTSTATQKWVLAYDAYARDFGEEEAETKLLYLMENKQDFPSSLIQHALGDGYVSRINRLSVRRNRSSNSLEISQTQSTPLRVVLVFDDKDTVVQLGGKTAVCIEGVGIPKTYYPLDPLSPVEFTLSDGQAFTLLQMRTDARSRYWAMRSLLASSSPYTQATAASFGVDDPLSVIREIAFDASLDIPGFAAARMKLGWEQVRKEGSYAQALLATEQLINKLNVDVALPVYPCKSSYIKWSESPSNTMCNWTLRFKEEPKEVLLEIRNTLSNLNVHSRTYAKEKAELEALHAILEWEKSF